MVGLGVLQGSNSNMLNKSRQLKPEERFRAVDFVAEEIFGAMPDLAQSEPVKNQRSELTETHGTPNVVNLFSEPSDGADQVPVRAETLRVTLLKALDEIMKAAEDGSLLTTQPPVNNRTTSAEMLRGIPDTRSEEEMLASIRTLIRHQEQTPTHLHPVKDGTSTLEGESSKPSSVTKPPQTEETGDGSQGSYSSSVLLKKLFGN